jgi:hypothetical protein
MTLFTHPSSAKMLRTSEDEDVKVNSDEK